MCMTKTKADNVLGLWIMWGHHFMLLNGWEKKDDVITEVLNIILIKLEFN